MKKTYTRTIFLQITAIICGFFLISSSGCEETGPSKVVIHTDFGDMVVLLSDSTPAHRDNFLKLAQEGFYNDLLFHRVMSEFMVQGGDPKSKGAGPDVRLGSGGPGYKIDAEIRSDHLHVKGALAAARQGDQSNPARRSSGSQFYIVHGKKWTAAELERFENSASLLVSGFKYPEEVKTVYQELGGAPFLDMNYTVFGMVVEGLDIIDSIAAVQVKDGNRPIEDVKFSVEVLK
jgi:peptidyl-prolyl cis-trans isomerase B (cyclophilin B)